eukprot:5182342-Prymnesium_polylepis.2
MKRTERAHDVGHVGVRCSQQIDDHSGLPGPTSVSHTATAWRELDRSLLHPRFDSRARRRCLVGLALPRRRCRGPAAAARGCPTRRRASLRFTALWHR